MEKNMGKSKREKINNVIIYVIHGRVLLRVQDIQYKNFIYRGTPTNSKLVQYLYIYVCFCVFLLIQLVILRIEVNYLLEVELKQRRTIIIQQPQHVLEQNRIHIHENHPLLAPMIHNEILLLIILLHHLNQNPKGAFFQHKWIHQELSLLLPDHHGHLMPRLLEPLFG